MNEFIGYIVTLICAVLASGGLWSLLQKRADKKDNRTQLLLGICYDRVFYLGMIYIERGWITREELSNLQTHLAEPYYALGGNGAIKRIMGEVEKLQIKSIDMFYIKKVGQ